MNKTSKVPIKKIEGIELTVTNGIARATITDQSKVNDLSWDRYVRLNAVANTIQKTLNSDETILDVGGYDGALGFFLPKHCIDLIDPESTGCNLLDEETKDLSYDLVASVDVLEHIEPTSRQEALKKLMSFSKKHLVLNYPHRKSKEAQELVFKATGNKLIEEHCKWALPDSNWVLEILSQNGFQGKVHEHSNLAIWLGQYLTLNLAPEAAQALNSYLIEHHSDEPFTTPLYDLVFASRN